jgi:hypothetical protein
MPPFTPRDSGGPASKWSPESWERSRSRYCHDELKNRILLRLSQALSIVKRESSGVSVNETLPEGSSWAELVAGLLELIDAAEACLSPVVRCTVS